MGFGKLLLAGMLSLAFPLSATAEEARFSAAWWHARWLGPAATKAETEREIRQMLEILGTTKAGADLIQAAKSREPQFLRRLTVGPNSLTETVFSRSFSLEDGSESLEVENFLRLNRNLSRRDLVLDLGHELTHFVYRSPANPYGEHHSLRDFIREGIEGEGGELDAFRMECLVSWELEKTRDLPVHEICARYRRAENGGELAFARERARAEYYNVGRYYRSLAPLKKYFPELNEGVVVFSSSLQKAPYPYALVKEYAFVRKVACENNQRKAKLIATQSARLKKSRVPAAAIENLSRERLRLEQYARTNCGAFTDKDAHAR